MTFQIEAHEDDHRQLVARVTVDEERIAGQMQRTARRLARALRIPGFRPGKAPYRVIAAQVGEEALRLEALDDMWGPLIDEVLTQLAPELYGEPQPDNLTIKPLGFTLTIPLRPQVVLGDYRALRLETQPVTITDEAVTEVLENIRNQHTERQPTNQPAAMGDMVVIAGQGYLSDDPTDVIFNETRFEITLTPDALYPGTGFTDQLLGVTPGDERRFELTFPPTYEPEPAWQQKTATFDLTILDVWAVIRPELDDALAEKERYESLDELRYSVAQELQQQAQMQYRNDAYTHMMAQLMEGVQTLRYPPVLITDHQDELLENLKRQTARSNLKWEEYLAQAGKTEQELRDDLEERAVNEVERSLLIREFVKQEGLKVTDNDLTARVDQLTARYADNPDLQRSIREFYLSETGAPRLADDILMDKIYDRMVAILSGAAPDLTAAAEAQEFDLPGEALAASAASLTEAEEFIAEAANLMEAAAEATTETAETPTTEAVEAAIDPTDDAPKSGNA